MNELDRHPYLEMTRAERLEFSGPFNHRLLELRRRAGLSWRALAEIVGRPMSHIAKIERGENRMTPKLSFALADFFHVNINDFLGMPSEREMRALDENIINAKAEKWDTDLSYLSLSTAEKANYTFPCRNFRVIRSASALSFTEIAAKVGCSRSVWYAWEDMKALPTMAMCFFLSSILGISVYTLLGIPDCGSSSEEKHNQQIGTWSNVLDPITLEAVSEIEQEIKRVVADGGRIIPQPEEVFRPFVLTPPDKAKVVIVNDTVAALPQQADGLAFSAAHTSAYKLPAWKSSSVQNMIYWHPKHLRDLFRAYIDGLGLPEPQTNDLSPWARRGVLLLNLRAIRAFDSDGVELHSMVKNARNLVRGTLDYLARQDQTMVYVFFSSRTKGLQTYLNTIGVDTSRIIVSPSTKVRSLPVDFFPHINELLISMGSTPVDWSL